ncbi:MAG: hypothetical protein JOZ83_14485 [Silvibacterium sp.]|nr:hypothetical protein [Silvibacterium sp.]
MAILLPIRHSTSPDNIICDITIAPGVALGVSAGWGHRSQRCRETISAKLPVDQ